MKPSCGYAESAITPFGADRPKARNVFNIRASYTDEAEQLVQHPVVVKLFVAKRDQLKGVFWALVRAPVCLG